MIGLLPHFYLAACTTTSKFIPSQAEINSCGISIVPRLVENAVSIAMFIVGAVSLVFLLVGAFQYTISGGNPQAVAKAKQTITFAVVGLGIAILAVVIVNFVRGAFS